MLHCQGPLDPSGFTNRVFFPTFFLSGQSFPLQVPFWNFLFGFVESAVSLVCSLFHKPLLILFLPHFCPEYVDCKPSLGRACLLHYRFSRPVLQLNISLREAISFIVALGVLSRSASCRALWPPEFPERS